MNRNSIGILAWLFTREEDKHVRAVRLAQKSAAAGSPFGHLALYELLKMQQDPRAVRQLEVACSNQDRQLGDICSL